MPNYISDQTPSTQPPCGLLQDPNPSDGVRSSPGFVRGLHRLTEAGPSRISPEGHSRRRQSSFSIVYNSDGDGSSPWAFTLEVQDSGDESVHSVQVRASRL